MIRIVQSLLAGLAICLVLSAPTLAHPHVWVTVKSQVVYGADGAVIGVRHAWTFDDMFSTMAVQGLPSKKKGVFTREELQPLAEVNVTSLKEYSYFNFATANGKKAEFGEPVDYYLEQVNSLLTLHFMLPLKQPLKARAIDLEVYDPSYFVDFAFAEKEAAALVNAPSRCRVSVQGPSNVPQQQLRLSELFFSSPAAANFGAQFANKISVRC